MQPSLVLAAALALGSAPSAAEALLLPAQAFARYSLSDGSGAARIRAARNLAAGGCCVSGWVEYEFAISRRGWYRLFVHGSAYGVDFLLDPGGDGSAAQHFRGGSGYNDARDKIGNLWLTPGIHRLRLQRHYWTGFPSLAAVELQPSGDTLADAAAYRLPAHGGIYRRGECPALELLAGGLPRPARLTVSVKDAASHAVIGGQELDIPAGPEPVRRRIPLPCDGEGRRWLSFGEFRGEGHWPIDNRGIKGLAYEVIDTRGTARLPSLRPPGLVQEIDCARRDPDYTGGGATRVVRKPFGAYRESGDRGWTRYQRAPEAARRLLPGPSWFAYALEGLAPQQRYRIEVDYPDDAWRTFGAVLREAAPHRYPVAVGADTGGEYRISDSMQTLSMTLWPRSGTERPRLVFMTAHDGSRAACSRIRIHRADAPAPLAPGAGGRQFLSFSEEGSNYAAMFGPPDEGPRGRGIAAQRWAEAVSAMGGTTLVPTVAIYDFTLYPSAYNRMFSDPADDVLRRIVLAAEKYHLKVIPELHPRGDDLLFGMAETRRPPEMLLVSKEGKTRFLAADGTSRIYPPYFNPLRPEVQNWYVGMIGELAERYRDSPALEGVSLRWMQWANAALNNLVSLDWGYDDFTVDLFRRATALPVPMGRPGDPGRFAARHAWLTGPGRAAWIEWRCRRMTELYRRIAARLRRARPDLKLYLNVFAADELYAPGFARQPGRSIVGRLREAGIDPGQLAAVEGLVLINAAYGYGRREPDSAWQGARDPLLDPPNLHALHRPGDGGRFLSGHYYLEATEAVVPPERLGFSAATKATWTGVVTNPAGRQALERYALQLAETDAVMLGDGGNGYSYGPPVVAEFMAEYRTLPALPFANRADGVDPVTVRTLAGGEAFLFYAVNRERYPVRVSIALAGAAEVARLAGGAPLPLQDGTLQLELQPYELIALRAPPAARIAGIVTAVPAAERAAVAAQVDWLARLGRSSRLGAWVAGGPTQAERPLLADALAQARLALDQGRYWRARTVLEHSALLALYRRMGCYPPGLREGEGHRSDCLE